MQTLASFNPLAAHLTAALLNSAWQGALITLWAALALRLSSRLNATTRYFAWVWTLLALAGLTCFHLSQAFPHRSRAQELSSVPLAGARVSLNEIASASDFPTVMEAAPTPMEALAAPAAPIPPARRAELPSTAAWPVLFLGAWAAAAAIALARLGCAWRHLRALRRRSVPVAEELERRLKGLLAACGVRRPVEFRRSNDVATPVVAGLYRPAILLPEPLVASWSGDEIDQVILHEAAHVARRDDWAILGQQLIRAVLCFQPGVHWCCSRMTLDRELACDEWVACTGRQPKAFARCLLKMAESLQPARESQLAPGMLSKRGHLARRVEALCQEKRPGSIRLSRIGCFVTAVLLGIGCWAAAKSPCLAVAAEAPAAVFRNDQIPAEPKDEAAPPNQEQDQELARIEKIKEDLARRQKQLLEAHKKLEALKRAQANEAEPLDREAIEQDERVEMLKKELADAKDELATIQQRYKAKHPAYIRAEGKIQQLKSEYDKSVNRALENRLKQLKEELAAKDEEFKKALMAQSKGSAGNFKPSSSSDPAADRPMSEVESFLQEIALAEQQLKLAQIAEKAGRAPQGEVIKLQRDILRLKREMAAAEKKKAPRDILFGGAPATEEELTKSRELRQQVAASLKEMVQREENPALRVNAVAALVTLQDAETPRLLQELVLTDKDQHVRELALSAIAGARTRESREVLLLLYDQLGDDDLALRRMIVSRMTSLDGIDKQEDRLALAAKVIDKLKDIANKSASAELRKDAIRQLGSIGEQLDRNR